MRSRIGFGPSRSCARRPLDPITQAKAKTTADTLPVRWGTCDSSRRQAGLDGSVQGVVGAFGMKPTNDSDWSRAFFARLAACLGTIPFALSCGILLFGTLASDWKVVELLALPALALLSTSMILGHWRWKSAHKDAEAWHLGLFGSVFVGTELALSGLLIIRGAAIHFTYH